jgi:hypothetical protein
MRGDLPGHGKGKGRLQAEAAEELLPTGGQGPVGHLEGGGNSVLLRRVSTDP